MKIVYSGKEFDVQESINGFEAAKLVDPEKKNKALAFRQDGKLFDMNHVVNGGEISFVMPEDPDGFEMLNHSCSHLMAQALMHLYPGCLFGFGPAIE
ncbi:MAG: threonine--tRNA ligase, partial [Candidatus Enteromonas sp.]